MDRQRACPHDRGSHPFPLLLISLTFNVNHFLFIGGQVECGCYNHGHDAGLAGPTQEPPGRLRQEHRTAQPVVPVDEPAVLFAVPLGVWPVGEEVPRERRGAFRLCASGHPDRSLTCHLCNGRSLYPFYEFTRSSVSSNASRRTYVTNCTTVYSLDAMVPLL